MLLDLKNEAIEKEGQGTLFAVDEKLSEHFYLLHQSCVKNGATPRQYLNFLHNYINVFTSKKDGIEKRRQHLQVNKQYFTGSYDLSENFKM